MIKNSKSSRMLSCALALGAFACGMAQAQTVVPPVASSAANVVPLRVLSIVTEQGAFKREFDSFVEAMTSAQGNSYNQTLKNGSEIIVMNAPPTEGEFVGKVTVSLYEISRTNLEPLVKSYLDYCAANPEALDKPETRQREQAMIDGIMKNLAASPSQLPPNTVPVALSLAIREAPKPKVDEAQTPSSESKTNPGLVQLPGIRNVLFRLEADDAQNPLIGQKINDGTLYETVFGKFKPRAKRQDLEKYGYNRFANAQDAVGVATIIPGTKAIIFNGTNFSLYRIDAFKFDYKAGDARFDVLKTTPMPKGWIIVAVVVGTKIIRIYDPKSGE